jgi:hypothetical protein
VKMRECEDGKLRFIKTFLCLCGYWLEKEKIFRPQRAQRTQREYDENAKMRRCEGGLLLPQNRHEIFHFTFYIFNFTFGQRQWLEKREDY